MKQAHFLTESNLFGKPLLQKEFNLSFELNENDWEEVPHSFYFYKIKGTSSVIFHYWFTEIKRLRIYGPIKVSILPLVIATIEHEKLEKYIHREISHQGFKWLRKEAIIVTAILLERNILAYEDIDSVHLPSTLKYTQLFSKKTSHSLRRYLPEINKKEGKQFDIKLSCWKESWEKETLLTYEKDQKFLIIYI